MIWNDTAVFFNNGNPPIWAHFAGTRIRVEKFIHNPLRRKERVRARYFQLKGTRLQPYRRAPQQSAADRCEWPSEHFTTN